MPELPEQFIKRVTKQFGNNSNRFLDALSLPPVVSLRRNPNPGKNADLWSDLENVPWCDKGYYLPQKPGYTLDPLFHAGCYYPQEASSMIIDWILRYIETIPANPVVLDLCAAPGGKSTLLASWMKGKGLLIANEIIRNRSFILLENMIKWGAPNFIVSQNTPADFSPLKSFFDLIVIDAPCSGEGMFRKEKRAIDEWSENNAVMCANRQREILDDIWQTLKPGGTLIYSTCTFNPSENENNISRFAIDNNAEVLQFTPPESWGITSINIAAGNGLAFYPHLAKGEGFFVAAIRKPYEKEHAFISKKQKNTNPTKANPYFLSLLTPFVDWTFIEEKNHINAFPKQYHNQLYLLKKSLNILNFGIDMGEIGHKGFMPSHALAMNSAFRNNNHFLETELELDDALKYLKGEALPSSGAQKGYILLTYKKTALGFGKEIGSRINNLYPANWRIRMKI